MLRARQKSLHNETVLKVLLVSGGSGGHLIPAMTLARSLRSGDRCLMVSTHRPIDQLIEASAGGNGGGALDWQAVNLQPFTPLWRWFFPGYLLEQMRAVGAVRAILRREKPDVVVGFGGYLSAVGVVAAHSAGIPSVIHEQNVLPGRANRLLARLTDAVAISFPETKRHLSSRATVEVTGNPVRFRAGQVSGEESRSFFGLDPDRPVLLVIGGSQGSRTVNRLTLEMWEGCAEAGRREIQVLHLSGSQQAKEVEEGYRRLGMTAVVRPFAQEMDRVFPAATLAIARAGATGIAEMVAMGVPSILIPYPYAGAHQRANAQWMQSVGGAEVLEETGLTPERLGRQARALLADPDRLERMRRALRAQADGSAAERLAAMVRRVAAKKR